MNANHDAGSWTRNPNRWKMLKSHVKSRQDPEGIRCTMVLVSVQLQAAARMVLSCVTRVCTSFVSFSVSLASANAIVRRMSYCALKG